MRSHIWDRLAAILLVLLSVLSMFLTYTIFNFTHDFASIPLPRIQVEEDLYAKIIHDPNSLSTIPGVHLDTVMLAVEESVHFAIHDTESSAEWTTTFVDPVPSVRLGRNLHPFVVSMYHEIHCIQNIRTALVEPSHADWGHLSHCFNYLREWVMCQADLTLEPGDFVTRNFTEERVGAIHACHDWSAIVTFVDDNWKQWISIWRQMHNITDMA